MIPLSPILSSNSVSALLAPSLIRVHNRLFCAEHRLLTTSVFNSEFLDCFRSNSVHVCLLFRYFLYRQSPDSFSPFPRQLSRICETPLVDLVGYISDHIKFCSFRIDSMSSTVSPQWQDRASDFFSNSGSLVFDLLQFFFPLPSRLCIVTIWIGMFFNIGVKIKEASHNVADAAEKVGTAVKSKWSLFQQPSTKHAMQERFLSAAASTSLFLRKGFSGTKDKVVVGKVKVEEVLVLLLQ